MRKAVLFAVTALLLLTACGQLARDPPVLPDPADVARVVLTEGRKEAVCRDGALIARLLRMLEQAVPTVGAGPEDMEGAWSVCVDFGFRSGGESRIFLCRRNGTWLMEQPFQGVWQVDGPVGELLKEAAGWIF